MSLTEYNKACHPAVPPETAFTPLRIEICPVVGCIVNGTDGLPTPLTLLFPAVMEYTIGIGIVRAREAIVASSKVVK